MGDYVETLANWAVPKNIVIIVVIFFVAKWVRDLVVDPLRNVPGPFLARYTRLWLLRQYMKGDFQKTNISLHNKYGPVVRIAPNQYSIDDPNSAKIIYGHGTDFVKSNWYIPFGHADPNFRNLFNDVDAKSHSELRRKVASVYSMSSLVSYEPYVDECNTLLLERMFEFADSGAVFDMGHWFQCYAFEVIGKITRLGFLDAGEDIHGIMEALGFGTFYSSIVGLYSSWHRPLLTFIQSISSDVKGPAFIESYADGHVESRRHEKVSAEGPSDFIGKFLAIQGENPAKMTDKDIKVSSIVNVAAGSDTTSITLSAILYYLCKTPPTATKLREELDAAASAGRISDPITFREAQALPYLQAVIKEALRIHPATGFTMPRVVPRGGKTIVGRHFPGGTVVGINSWVAHRNRAVFGDDADHFRPERWLEVEECSSQREAYFLPFGQGSRTCIGKNISLLELSKVVPQVLRQIDIELEHEGEWSCATHWFVKPQNLTCRIRRRS